MLSTNESTAQSNQDTATDLAIEDFAKGIKNTKGEL